MLNPKKHPGFRMSDEQILDEAKVACPCGETGHPREQCAPDYLAEIDAVPDCKVPDGPSGQCWDCRRLAAHSAGPHGTFARRVRFLLENFS